MAKRFRFGMLSILTVITLLCLFIFFIPRPAPVRYKILGGEATFIEACSEKALHYAAIEPIQSVMQKTTDGVYVHHLTLSKGENDEKLRVFREALATEIRNSKRYSTKSLSWGVGQTEILLLASLFPVRPSLIFTVDAVATEEFREVRLIFVETTSGSNLVIEEE